MIKNELRNLVRKVRNLRHLWHLYLRNFALDVGVIEGHLGYNRFIVLGRSRTGSNFLHGLLNSHSQIIAFGELFQNYDSIAWGLSGYRQTKNLLSLFQNDPVRFLETKVFKRFPVHISAVGFKVFYYHAQSDKWKPVWAYLGDQRELRIIHVKRKNILKTHLSRKRAALTDTWVNVSGEPEEGVPISLDYEECLEDFVRTRDWEAKYDVFFEGHSKLEVLYENLSFDYQSEMKRVQDFLGVNYEFVKPSTYKQSSQSLSRAISNYFELRERFTGTPWEEFFEDQVL